VRIDEFVQDVFGVVCAAVVDDDYVVAVIQDLLNHGFQGSCIVIGWNDDATAQLLHLAGDGFLFVRRHGHREQK